jgi:hypothetical protein
MTPVSTLHDDLVQVHEKLGVIEQTPAKIDRISLFADLMFFFSNRTTFTHHPHFRNVLIDKINDCRNEIWNACHINGEQEENIAGFEMLQACEYLETAIQHLEIAMNRTHI